MLPTLLSNGGPVVWLLIIISGVAIVVFIERLLHCHRAQINSTEFLNGVRTVLRRDNVIEAISICDATPGPVARLVKTAILAREQGLSEAITLRVLHPLDDAAELARINPLGRVPASHHRRLAATRRASRRVPVCAVAAC